MLDTEKMLEIKNIKAMIWDALKRAYPDRKIPDMDMTPLFHSLKRRYFLIENEVIKEFMNEFRRNDNV